MPVMEITAEMVGPNRTRLSLAYIEALMLWPNDESQQAEALRTSTASFIKDAIEAVPAAQRATAAAEWLDWFGLAIEAMPIRIVRKQAQKPFVYGVIAGELLSAAIGDFTVDGHVKLQSIKKEICDMGSKRKPISELFGVSVSTLENTIWGEFKPVAHLWAAYLCNSLAGDATFPCRLGQFPEFLGLAEFFREEGEKIHLPRRSDTLLTPGKQWCVPAVLDVPRVTVRFGERRSMHRSKGA